MQTDSQNLSLKMELGVKKWDIMEFPAVPTHLRAGKTRQGSKGFL